MAEVFILAVASAFWPLLIAIVLVALRTPHPVRLLGWFLAGGIVTAVIEGAVLVFSLEGTKFATGHKPAADPVLGISAGSVALVLAAFLFLRRGRPRKEHAKRPWGERLVERGAALAFAAGVVLDLFPGIFPIVAMKDIAQLHYGHGGKLGLVVAFYAIVFTFVEVPIVADLIAHDRTLAAAHRVNAWLGRNARSLITGVLAAAGTYLLVRALVRLVAS